MKPTKEQFFHAVTQIEGFSPAPAILASAMRLLNDPRSDIQSIAALVGRDSALTADIIRSANSAYFGGLISRSISEAVQKIGMSETLRLLNLAVSKVVSSRDLGSYGIHGTSYWAESLFNGLFLQALTKETGAGDPDEAYTAGLLRYIGRLAIDHAIENLQGGLFWDRSQPIAAWEMDNVGLLQAQAGAALLKKWRFSDTMVDAIGGQDDPTKLATENWLAEALHFASELLPQGVGVPFTPAQTTAWTPSPSAAEFMRRHELSQTDVESLLQSTSESFESIRKHFGG